MQSSVQCFSQPILPPFQRNLAAKRPGRKPSLKIKFEKRSAKKQVETWTKKTFN
jgi:hypothetical protein